MTTLPTPTYHSQRQAPKARWINSSSATAQATSAAISHTLNLQMDHIDRRKHEMIQLSLLLVTVIATCVAIVVG